jgi:hypothetical protein
MLLELVLLAAATSEVTEARHALACSMQGGADSCAELVCSMTAMANTTTPVLMRRWLKMPAICTLYCDILRSMLDLR